MNTFDVTSQKNKEHPLGDGAKAGLFVRRANLSIWALPTCIRRLHCSASKYRNLFWTTACERSHWFGVGSISTTEPQ
jgi:hypothetical protein